MNGKAADIGCIVLAAGYSRRFGADKRQALLQGGSTLLDLTLASVPPLFSQYLLVLHAGDEALAARHAPRWQGLLAKDAERGMGHSLAAAMACTEGWQAAVIVLGDMPGVAPATYAAIVSNLDNRHLVVPCHRGQRGNPVGIGADFFAEVASLQGDQGARRLLLAHADAVVRLEVEDPGILQDADTLEELAALQSRPGPDTGPGK